MFALALPTLLLASSALAYVRPPTHPLFAAGAPSDVVPRRCGSHLDSDAVARAETRFASFARLGSKINGKLADGTATPVNISVYWHTVSKNETVAGGNTP